MRMHAHLVVLIQVLNGLSEEDNGGTLLLRLQGEVALAQKDYQLALTRCIAHYSSLSFFTPSLSLPPQSQCSS